MEQEWYASWFDNPYYHLLYKNRDQGEAERFICNLVKTLNLPKNGSVLDLACGKGRHSKCLHDLGFNVLGADLSPNSISEAKKLASERLNFIVHDMREQIENIRFDAVFNLFTSFGYFDQKSDNLKVINAANAMLKNGGLLIIDFMNAHKVKANLVAAETKKINDVQFEISRRHNNDFIFKTIRIVDDGHTEEYTERVQALELSDFSEMLSQSGFEILRTFGDFELNEFLKDKSDRLIIVARKI